MVEGRISAGVVVGEGSDIGGGASIQGTLSGGGKEVISIGEGCLLGANAGLGISLGDRCTVQAGLLRPRRHPGHHARRPGRQGRRAVGPVATCCSARTPRPARWRSSRRPSTGARSTPPSTRTTERADDRLHPAAVPLRPARRRCRRRPTPLPGGLVDLSIGTPCDPPPAVRWWRPWPTRRRPGATRRRSAPPAYREAAAGWLARRFGVEVDPGRRWRRASAPRSWWRACPQWLRLRTPERDTVLYPAISYPTYAMGATLAGCRAVPVPVDDRWRIRLDAIDPADAARALCLWVNTPGNPAGGLDDLGAAAAWGRAHGVPVLSDECYAEFTWDGPAPHDPPARHRRRGRRPLAVEALELRRRPGRASTPATPSWSPTCPRSASTPASWSRARCRPPAPLAWADDDHVAEQRDRYRERLDAPGRRPRRDRARRRRCPPGPSTSGSPAPDGDAWALAERLADRGRRRWSARGSSTARPAPATSAWPPCSRSTGSRPPWSAWPG